VFKSLTEFIGKLKKITGGPEDEAKYGEPIKMKGWIAIRDDQLADGKSYETSRIYLGDRWRSFANWDARGYKTQEIEFIVKPQLKNEEGNPE